MSFMSELLRRILLILGIGLCICAVYLLNQQSKKFSNELSDKETELIQIETNTNSVTEGATVSRDVQLENVVSVFDRADAKCSQVVNVENDINSIIADLSDVNLDVNEEELYQKLFENYDYIDSVFGESAHLDIPWFALNMKKDGASDYKWVYYLSKSIDKSCTNVVFLLENSGHDVLMYLLGLYDADTDTISYLDRRGTSNAGDFMLYTIDNNEYQGDISQDDFVNSVYSLLDELHSDPALSDIPDIDPIDDDWNDIVDARDDLAVEENDPCMIGS